MPSRLARLASFAPVLLTLAGGCSTPTDEGAPSSTISLTLVSGDAQTAPAGSELPGPLVVKATDNTGKILKGYLVTFRVSGGGGRMYAGTSLTDSRGIAQDWWTLGPAAGAQRVDVVAVDPLTGQKQNFGTFNATATPPTVLSLSPSPHSFGTLPIHLSSAEQVFTLSNTGGSASGAITLSVTGLHATEFAIGTDTCTGASLGAGSSCTVGVTFTPLDLGAHTATLSASGPGVGASATLLGVGGAEEAGLSIAPDPLAFPSVAIGEPAVDWIQVSNVGPAASGPLLLSFSGSHTSDFTLESDACSGQSVPAGGFCLVMISFNPTRPGSRSATLNVTGTPGGNVPVGLTGTGLASPLLSGSVSVLNFGSVGMNSSAQLAFTVTNTGGSIARDLAVVGPGGGDFTFDGSTDCAGDLAAGASCTVMVRFAPSSMGLRTGTLSVTSSNTGPASVALAGLGVTGTEFSVLAQSWFDVIAVGGSSDVDFVVENPGTVSAVVGLSVTGSSAFALVTGGTCQSGTTVLAPGDFCTVRVRFSPITAGDVLGELRVSANPGKTTVVPLSATAF